MDEQKISELKQIINDNHRIVIFSGAGLSTNSGIPDFRSAEGLFNQKLNYLVRPEEIISHHFFKENPEDFYDFYFKKLIYPNALPNCAHYYFANLEKTKDVSVVTQNIDNLHQMAGSKNVIELHGSVIRNYCQKCHKYYDVNDFPHQGVPHCSCGGTIKPDVVLYEEGLNDDVISEAIKVISEAQVLIIVGTSLSVYPAAAFVNYFRGKDIILINKTITPFDNNATLCFHEDIKEVIEALEKK